MFDPTVSRVRVYRTKVLQSMAGLIQAPDSVIERAGGGVNAQSGYCNALPSLQLSSTPG
jgi:hypothetical protein